MMLYADTGELGRAPIGAHATSGMFLCPGFGRDLYAASLWGPIARIFVATP